MATSGAAAPSSPPPSVTVVVPTFNRRDYVTELIGALRQQTHTGFRVVVVDDGSVDDTCDLAHAAIGADPRFTLISTANRGPACARNTGWRAASTDWVAFTDDDCLPQPGWLAGLLAEAEAAEADVVQGQTVPDPTVRTDGPPWFVRSLRVRSWSGRFQTCNLLVRTALLQELDGFDETFGRPIGEDTDLGLRMLGAGATTAFAAEAEVHHRVLPMTYRQFLRRRSHWAQVVQLVKVNPDARAIFPHRYVAHRSHAAFWVSLPLVGWALAQRLWAVPLVALVAYSAMRSYKSRDRGGNPLWRMAWGATELGGVAVGAVSFAIESVRYRRLLL